MIFDTPDLVMQFVQQNPRWILGALSVLGGSILLYFWTKWPEFIALSIGAFLYLLPFTRWH